MIDHEELDYSLYFESKMTESETKAWISCFLTNYVPTFEQARSYLNKKNIRITKKQYDDVYKKGFYKKLPKI